MEAFSLASDTENRIVIGGKRKSSSRRSSILKASKSPLKSGVLMDLDPNSLDDNERSQSKKSRRSSGRRVSFAEKNDVKEYHIEEDWFLTSMANETNESENEVPNRTVEGGYREPADKIKGMESLLKGNIKADGTQIHEAAFQEMAEIQFNKVTATKVENSFSDDRGIVLQNLGPHGTKHGVEIFTPAPAFSYQMQSETRREYENLEMDCTKCHEFGNSIDDSSENKTMYFGGDANREDNLDLTCTQQEIFFRDNPEVPILNKSAESSYKIDSKSFLMSLGSKALLNQTNQQGKDPLNRNSTGNVPQQRKPLGEITRDKVSISIDECVEIKNSCEVENAVYNPVQLDITSCHGYGILPRKSSFVEDETEVFTAESDSSQSLDLTLCLGRDLSFPRCSQASRDMEKKDPTDFLKSLGTVSQPKAEDTIEKERFENKNPLMRVADAHVASSVFQEAPVKQQGFKNYSTKQESGATNGHSFLVGLLTPPKVETGTTYFHGEEHLDLTSCHSQTIIESGIQGVKRNLTPCYGFEISEFHYGAANEESEMDVTKSLRSAVYKKEIASDGNILTCQSINSKTLETRDKESFGKFLDSSNKNLKRRSCYEAADVDVTSCYGPVLVQSLSGKHAVNNDRDDHDSSNEMDLTENHGQIASSRIKQADYSSGAQQKDVYLMKTTKVDNHGHDNLQPKVDEPLKSPVCHSQEVLNITQQGAVAGNGSFASEPDRGQLSGGTQNSQTGEYTSKQRESRCDENLDLTASHGQFTTESCQQHKYIKRRSLYEPTNVDLTMCYGPGLVKSPNTDGIPNDYGDKNGMDLTIIKSGQGAFSSNVTENASVTKRNVCSASTREGPAETRDQNSIEACTDIDVPAQDENGCFSAQDVNQISYFKFHVDTRACLRPVTNRACPGDVQDILKPIPTCETQYSDSKAKRYLEPADKATGMIGPNDERHRSRLTKEELNMSIDDQRGVVQASASNTKPFSEADLLPGIGGCNFNINSFVSIDKMNVSLTNQNSIIKSNDVEAKDFPEVEQTTSLLDNGDCNNKSFVTTEEMKPLINDNNSISKPSPITEKGLSTVEQPTLIPGHDGFRSRSLLLTTEEMNLSVNDQITEVKSSGIKSKRCSEQEKDSNVSLHDDRSYPSDEDTNVPLCNQNRPLDDHEKCVCETKESRKPSVPVERVSSTIHCSLTDTDGVCTDHPEHRKLSIISEEIESELTRTGKTDSLSQRTQVQSPSKFINPITLEEFLDISKIMFLKEEACIRRNTIVASSNTVVAPTVPAEIVFSSLVDKPKAMCYEEAIQAMEAEIKLIKEKVDQQKEELNANNPKVFGDIQSGSKEEVLNISKTLHHVKSMCEKCAKREWKEGQLKLNKKILSTMKENQQAIAGDVHVTQESLAMVDECLNLIDKMDKNLEEQIKGLHLSLESDEKKLQEQTHQTEDIQKMKEVLKTCDKELSELENERSSLQSEKNILVVNKEQLEATVLEHEKAVCSLKNKKPRFSETATKCMSQKLDILESLQEWSLEEWDSEHAKFTFLKGTLEMSLLFGKDLGTEGSLPNREISSIRLSPCLPDICSRYYRIVHNLLSLSINLQRFLMKMAPCQAHLAKALEHLSVIVYHARKIGEEVFSIGLSHLMSFKENKLIVEFSSLKAFVKFLVEIQLDVQSYPDSGVSFSCSPRIGKYSKLEIETALHAVHAGPRYLSRLVDAADKLLV